MIFGERLAFLDIHCGRLKLICLHPHREIFRVTEGVEGSGILIRTTELHEKGIDGSGVGCESCIDSELKQRLRTGMGRLYFHGSGMNDIKPLTLH